MATTATAPKGVFRCLPFLRIFQQDGAAKIKAPSETATASYTGGSSTSMMSVDPADQAEEMKVEAVRAAEAVTAGCGGEKSGREVCGYTIGSTLGKGMSGKVKRGHHKGNGRQVALKIIDKNSTPKRVLQMLGTEITAMRTLSAHPHVLQLLHYELSAQYPRKRGGKKDVVLLALELAEGGELFDFMMYTGAFSEGLAKAIFQQMVSALAYCHSHGIYHRDIKPENLLLTKDFQLKVADFGLAAMRSSPEELLKTECGTRSYMAPEVLARHQYDGQKSDCWSAGVVLFIMLSGNPPFQMARPGDWWFNQFLENRPDRFWKSHKRYSPHFPEAAQALLTRIFTPNPATRPTLADVLADPWVASSTMTQAEIQAELTQRKAKIVAAKANERERAKKKREAGQFGDAANDLNPDRVKHRDTSGAPVEVVEDPAPHATPKDLAVASILFTAEGPATAARGASEALAMMEAVMSEREDPYTIRATVPVDLEQVVLEVRVLSVPEDQTTVLCVRRVKGDPLAFQRAFAKFAAATTSLHGDAANDTPNGPLPLEEEESLRTQDSEGVLGQDVDMI